MKLKLYLLQQVPTDISVFEDTDCLLVKKGNFLAHKQNLFLRMPIRYADLPVPSLFFALNKNQLQRIWYKFSSDELRAFEEQMDELLTRKSLHRRVYFDEEKKASFIELSEDNFIFHITAQIGYHPEFTKPMKIDRNQSLGQIIENIQAKLAVIREAKFSPITVSARHTPS